MESSILFSCIWNLPSLASQRVTEGFLRSRVKNQKMSHCFFSSTSNLFYQSRNKIKSKFYDFWLFGSSPLAGLSMVNYICNALLNILLFGFSLGISWPCCLFSCSFFFPFFLLCFPWRLYLGAGKAPLRLKQESSPGRAPDSTFLPEGGSSWKPSGWRGWEVSKDGAE